jgi:hypothetical protein
MNLETSHSYWLVEVQVSSFDFPEKTSCHVDRVPEPVRVSSPSSPFTAPSLWGRKTTGRQDPPPFDSFGVDFASRADLVAGKTRDEPFTGTSSMEKWMGARLS